MNKLALLLALVSIPAAARPQTGENAGSRFDIAGEAPDACVVRAPTAISSLNASVTASSGTTSSIRITEMVDRSTAEPLGAEVDLALPVICNGPHRLTLRSGNGGLLRVGGAVGNVRGGFAEYVPYRIAAIWGPGQTSGGSDGGKPLSIESQSGRAGNLAVSIRVPRGGAPLVAGTYSDEIVLEFHAAN